MAAMLVQRIIVRGRVQGVGFRDFVARTAARHNLDGWVRNRRDGTVEALFSGATEDVASAVAACRRGPSSGHVDGVEIVAAADADLDLRRPGEKFSRLATL